MQVWHSQPYSLRDLAIVKAGLRQTRLRAREIIYGLYMHPVVYVYTLLGKGAWPHEQVGRYRFQGNDIWSASGAKYRGVIYR